MFGFFKKKRLPALSADWSAAIGKADHAVHQQMERAAALLKMQLLLCQHSAGYGSKVRSKFFRGYVVGFFDSALQWVRIPVNSDEELISFICVGHVYLSRPSESIKPLFGGNTGGALDFCLDSMSLQGDAEFGAAQAQGGTEFFDFASEKIPSPNGLVNYFHSK